MKRRGMRKICAFLVMCTILLGTVMNVAAEEGTGLFDGSRLTKEEKSEGYTYSNPLLRGEHLMDGQSAISKTGRGKIYAYGATTANHDVKFLGLIVYVDQFNEETNHWEQIDAWSLDDDNTYYISSGKTMKVEGGYYYRVHCEHFAGNEYPYESAISCTDGIWIE